MSSNKFEIEYYPEICRKFGDYLDDCFDGTRKFASSQNKSLHLMMEDIYSELDISRDGDLFPPLKTDIAFGVQHGGSVSPILLEVKLGETLRLIDYSQLVGYMQVARLIQVGLLVLVNTGNKASQLSSDFQNLIETQQLICEWQVTSEHSNAFNCFRTGICVYTPGNGIHWIDTKRCGGISDWSSLNESLIPKK